MISYPGRHVRNGRFTPYTTKPPNMPDQPLNEVHIRSRKGTSLCVYQMAVIMVSPGVTTASSSPRKKLGTDNGLPQLKHVVSNATNAPQISHETREIGASRSSVQRSAMLFTRCSDTSRT